MSEPFKLDGCTCEPTEDGSVRAYHFKSCPWAMSAPTERDQDE